MSRPETARVNMPWRKCRDEAGFTLIEALVAVAIAASALIVLSGRLGASADIQRTLAAQAMALGVAANELARHELFPAGSGHEAKFVVEFGDAEFNVRSWSEKTGLDGFVRRNVAVALPGEPEITLFVYREVRR